jgi:DNA-binding PadR family transcriptional regulator
MSKRRELEGRCDAPESHLPLTAATFHILLALMDGERHGYAIMQEVEGRSGSSVRLGPGTLYGSLKRLLDAGWIVESGEREDPRLGEERRRYYRITDHGVAVARAESLRLERMVTVAREKRLIGMEPA